MGRNFDIEEYNCNRCNGTGNDYKTLRYEDCPRCDGDGVTHGLFGGEKYCDPCDGSGSVSVADACRDCSGKGQLERRVKREVESEKKDNNWYDNDGNVRNTWD